MNPEQTGVRRSTQELLEQATTAMKNNGTPGQVAAVSVCDETIATLSKIEANLLETVQAGLIEISEQIADEQTMPNTPERILLDLVSDSTKGLKQAISAAFDQHRSVIVYQRNRFVFGKIKSVE